MKIKTLTLNIHRAINWCGIYDLKGIIRFIQSENPDIIGLQEVVQSLGFGRRFLDIPGELAKCLQMFSFYSIALKRKSFNFGNLILSKYPIIRAWSCLLPGELEPRSFAFAQVLINSTRVNFLTTHLGLSESDRWWQVTRILEFTNQINGPLIITGDFNAVAEDRAVKMLREKYLDLLDCGNIKQSGTLRLKNGKIDSRIDYILTTPEFKYAKFQIVDNYISDHLPVIGEFSLEIDYLDIAGEPVIIQSQYF